MQLIIIAALSILSEFARPNSPEGLSGITRAPDGRYFAVEDKGGNVYELSLDIHKGGGKCEIANKFHLKDGVADFEGCAFDPLTGWVWVANEKDSTITAYELTSGRVQGKVEIPDVYRKSIRYNRSFESLTITSDGLKMYTANEDTLMCDGDKAAKGRGGIVRIQEFTRETATNEWKAARQFKYHTDAVVGTPFKNLAMSGVSGMAAKGDELYVLEREMSVKDLMPTFRSRVYRVKIGRENNKERLFDRDTIFSNYEGICIGPEIGGKATFVLISDGDGLANENVMVLADDTKCDLMHAPVNLRGSSFRGKPQHYNTITENYFNAIKDGDEATYWEPMEKRGPHFIEILFNQFVTAQAVTWQAEGVKGGKLSRFVKDKWEMVAKLDETDDEVEFTATASDRWRLDIEVKDLPKIHELHLFGQGQYLLKDEISRAKNAGMIELEAVELPTGCYQPCDEVEIAFKTKVRKDTPEFGLLIELSDREILDTIWDEGQDFSVRRWAAKPDTNGMVRLKMELPAWTPNGTNDIIVTALDDQQGARINMKTKLLGSIMVRRPDLPPMPPPVESVKIGDNERGQRGFIINGQWHPPFFNRFYGQPTPERVAATAKNGLKVLYWQNRDCMPVTEQELKNRILWFDRRIRQALRINPDNYFILSQVIKANSKWLKANPNETMRLENGEENPHHLVSFGSEKYLQDSEHFLRELIGFIQQRPYGNRVIGYHLWTCTLNDCFIGGCQKNSKIKDRRDFFIGDYHPGAIKLFREFLRKKYHGNVNELRQAWHDDKVDFENANVPRADILREDFAGQAFRDPVRSRNAIDYCEFFPTMIGRYHHRTTALIKRLTGGKALTMVHAGAVNGFLAKAWSEQLHANNNDFAELLADPNIDIFIQAQPYESREAGNAMHVFIPSKSVELNGKLHIFDHDHRTLGAGILKYGRHRSQYETEAIYRRDYAHQWIDNAGAWLSDMSLTRWWNFDEYRLPWYVMPEVYTPIRDTFSTLKSLKNIHKDVAEIAVVLSLNSPRYEDACRMVPLYKGLVNDVLLDAAFPFLGAPYDVILSSDLKNSKLPNYRLFVFMNPTYFAADELKAIEKLKRDGRTLAWFYAPGYATDKGLSTEAMKRLTGIELKVKEGVSEMPEMIFKEGPGLAQDLGTVQIPTVSWFGLSNFSPTVMSPIVYAEDDALQVAAVYADGKAAYGAKDMGTWKSVWCGVPNFSLPALVNLVKFAGVHRYAEAPVILNCDNRLMMIHNGYESERDITITFKNGKTMKVHLAAPETKLIEFE